MTDILVFAGPSLAGSAVRARFAARFLPPAAAGDLTAALASSPTAIVVLDMVTGMRPALRHREVLAALATGTPIHGAAGNGALLAIELRAHGMLGDGAVYHRYCDPDPPPDDALLCDYDVAADARRSEPLLQIDHLLTGAAADRIITPDDADAIRRAAASLHYMERTLATITALAGREHCHHSLLLRARDPRHDLMIRDAEVLLTRLCDGRRT